jgi:hypothetical protein
VFEEGRISALQTLLTLVKVLPIYPILQDQTVLIFIPMTMQLTNESSLTCRNVIIDVLTTIFRRVDSDMGSTLLEYAIKWFSISINPSDV